jgi:ABC-type nitrate/sulfonate/bicarbonate transport system substrate-binding protein
MMSALERSQGFFVKRPSIATFWFPLVFGIVILIYQIFSKKMPEALPDFSIKEELFTFVSSFLIGVLWQIFSENASMRRSIDSTLQLKDSEIEGKSSEIVKLSKDKADLKEKLKSAIVNKNEKISIGIANFNNFLPYIPLYVAEGCGFFDEEDISIYLRPHEDDLSAISAVARRASHFGITDPVFVFDDTVKDQDLKILAPFINKAAVWAISKTDLSTPHKQGTKGKTGGVKPLRIFTYDPETTANRISHKLADHLKKAGKASFLSVEAVQRGEDESIEEFFRREFVNGYAKFESADILVFSEPEISYLQQKLPAFAHKHALHNLLFGEDKFAFTAVIALNRSVEREREICKRFLKAIRHAQLFVYALPKLPSGDIKAFIDSKSNPWGRVVEAVHSNIMMCYPSEMVLSREGIAQLVEELRSSSYFSSSLAYQDQWMDGLRSAYKLAHGSKAVDLQKKTVDVTKALGLVTF